MLDEGRGVSIEMKQRRHVKTMMITDEAKGCVLFEGNLGKFAALSMVDDNVLEFRGVNGILRVDLSREEIARMLGRDCSGEASGSGWGSFTSTQIEGVGK